MRTICRIGIERVTAAPAQLRDILTRTGRSGAQAGWVALVCAVLVALAATPLAHAQEAQVVTAREWSPVAAIPGYVPTTLPPVMVADSNRTIHAFATLPLSDDPEDEASKESAIFYRQWTLESGWSKPNDIILSPIKRQARIKDVFLDKTDIMHMVFYGGDEQESYIYYTWAPASQAGFAPSWSPPLAIGAEPGEGVFAAITSDGGDNLVVAYGGNLGEGGSLYALYSNDAGATWSEPETVFSTYSNETKPFDFNWYLGESGTLHAVWNVTNLRGQNVAAFYAQLPGITSRAWSKPVSVDANVGLGLAALNVIEHQDKVMIIYNNGKGDEVAPVMWLKQSMDGGQTFSPPVQPFPQHVGRNGPVSFVVDSGGTLRGIFGQRIPGGLGGSVNWMGMWISTWQDFAWGPVTPLVSGPPTESFDPGDATAIISQGNVILLTYRTDPGRPVPGIWYTYRQLDAFELPVATLMPALAAGGVSAGSTNSAIPLALPTPTLAAAATAVEPIQQVSGEQPVFSVERAPAERGSPGAPIISALIPTTLFVVAILLFAGARRRQS